MIEMLTSRTATDGSETWMELISKKLLRRAMADTKTRTDGGPDCSSIPKLALAAQLSTAVVGFLVSQGRSGRTSCSVQTAHRIATAVGWDLDELFVQRSIPRSKPPTRADRLAALDGAVA